MHTTVLKIDGLSPQALDRALAEGWYRVGQTLITCRCLLFEDELRSAIWTRLPLEGFGFRPGLRKLMRRNARRYRVEVGEVCVDAAHQALYERYLTVARGDRPSTLDWILYGGAESDLFETREVRVFDGEELVAFSWFDLGEQAVQSLLGVYDPARGRDSLGFYTMLLEIEHALQHGLRWHYSGYVLLGNAAMDYKLRVGEVEFLHPELRHWRPWPEVGALDDPGARVARAFAQAAMALQDEGVAAAYRSYPMHEVPRRQPELARCLGAPVFLECPATPPRPRALLVTWSLDSERYSLLHAARAKGVAPSGDEIALWIVLEVLAHHTDAELLAREVAARL